MMNVREDITLVLLCKALINPENKSVTLLTVLYNRRLVIEEGFFRAGRNSSITRTVKWSFIRQVYKKAREQTHNPTASPSTAIRLFSGRHGIKEMHINLLLKPVHD